MFAVFALIANNKRCFVSTVKWLKKNTDVKEIDDISGVYPLVYVCPPICMSITMKWNLLSEVYSAALVETVISTSNSDQGAALPSGFMGGLRFVLFKSVSVILLNAEVAFMCGTLHAAAEWQHHTKTLKKKPVVWLLAMYMSQPHWCCTVLTHVRTAVNVASFHRSMMCWGLCKNQATLAEFVLHKKHGLQIPPHTK